jgi:hypothetical protein
MFVISWYNYCEAIVNKISDYEDKNMDIDFITCQQ